MPSWWEFKCVLGRDKFYKQHTLLGFSTYYIMSYKVQNVLHVYTQYTPACVYAVMYIIYIQRHRYVGYIHKAAYILLHWPFKCFSEVLLLTIFFLHTDYTDWDFPGGASGKESACQCRRHKRREFYPWGEEDPLEKGMATPSSILAWRIPGPEEPGRLQSIGPLRVGHN